MVSLPPQKCCTEGHLWAGTPKGDLTTFAQVTTYITQPPAPTRRVVLYLTDILGIHCPNPQLLADEIAAAGFVVVMPDIFNGDAWPLDVSWDVDGGRRFREWRERHTVDGAAKVREVLGRVLVEIRRVYGSVSIGVCGYCFGAKYVVQLLATDEVDAGFIAHPSFVTKEEIEAVRKPIFIAAAEEDHVFPMEKRMETEVVLKENKATYSIALFGGVSHGFAVRSDPNNKKEKFAKEKALSDLLYWFKAHLVDSSERQA